MGQWDDGDYLEHYGILGMKWGERRYQNEDGTLTPLGREHYGVGNSKKKKEPFITINIGGKKSKVTDHSSEHDAEHDTEHHGRKLPPKLLTDEEKQDVIRGGDPEEIMRYYRQFSRQELADAIQRARDLEAVTNLYKRMTPSEPSNVVDEGSSSASRLLKKKEKILKSGDMGKLLANKDLFSNQEINDAVNRRRTVDLIEGYLESDKKAKSIFNRGLDFIGGIVDKGVKLKSIYDKIDGLVRDPDAIAAKLSPEKVLDGIAKGSLDVDVLDAVRKRYSAMASANDALEKTEDAKASKEAKNKYKNKSMSELLGLLSSDDITSTERNVILKLYDDKASIHDKQSREAAYSKVYNDYTIDELINALPTFKDPLMLQAGRARLTLVLGKDAKKAAAASSPTIKTSKMGESETESKKRKEALTKELKDVEKKIRDLNAEYSEVIENKKAAAEAGRSYGVELAEAALRDIDEDLKKLGSRRVEIINKFGEL